MYRACSLYALWIALHIFSIPCAWARTSLPAQLGPHPVSIKDYVLHTNRPDPWAPKKELRKLMVTIYKPNIASSRCSNPSFIDYMPAKAASIFDDQFAATLPNGTMERVQLRNCAASKTLPRWWKKNPLLIFSPGLGNTRLSYSALMVAVASSGYTVVSLDHTYAASAVEFPGGEVAIGNQESQMDFSDPATVYASMQRMMPVQIADLDDVLHAIKAGKLPGLPRYDEPLEVGVFGHSLGGATVAAAMANDTRFVGGANYDGPLSRVSGNEGFDQPYLALGEAYLLTGSDDSWDDLWSHLRGWKSEISFNNTMHATFTDLPLLEKILGIRQTINASTYDTWYGSIDGQRAFELIWKYTVTFFDFVLKDKSPSLLQHNSTQYPEAVLIRGDFK